MSHPHLELLRRRYGVRNVPAFREAVARGTQRASEARVVLCGLARNVKKTVIPLLNQCYELVAGFADYRFVVYENDSTDGTQNLLRKWEGANAEGHVLLISEKLRLPAWPSQRIGARATALANCRNRYHSYVREHYADFDYAIVLDFDNYGFLLDGVMHTLGCEEPWDGVASLGMQRRGPDYSRGTFLNYDVWAWRDTPEATPKRPGDPQVMYQAIRRGGPLIPLVSAFGGLAIYRMASFLSASYAGEDCEHVKFHVAMRDAGHPNFFVNPAQLVAVK